MRNITVFRHAISITAITCILLVAGHDLASASAPVIFSSTNGEVVQTAALRDEINQFLKKELAAHLADIKSLDQPPDKVLGARTTGEYTWGTFMRSVAVYSELSGERTIAGRDVARTVGQIGLIEYNLKSARFSQLYAVQALRHFGRDLNTNPVWQGLSEDEKASWRKFLDISSFYDAKKGKVINLADNYLGVAARIASISYQLGILQDRALLDNVIDKAAEQFTKGSLFADDNPSTGRFDRYSNEYARFVWDAAQAADRQDIQQALRPTLIIQMKLWWDLILPDGYGYSWGRSMGIVSYEDTMEIVGFLAQNPEFRPAPLSDLASAYAKAWRWLRNDYRNDSHLLAVFAFGFGSYAYISPDREWQQTASFFGKTASSQMGLMPVLEREHITQFSAEIPRHDVARFQFFRKGDRPSGVWVVRQGPLFFTLPIVTGTKPGVADYLPAPSGLTGIAAPVEQVIPSMVPFIELGDGRVIVAGDCADQIEPGGEGRSLKAVWKRWAVIGSKSGQTIDPKITSEVTWHIDGTTLVREETLRAAADTAIKRWWVAVPTTFSRASERIENGLRVDRFDSNDSSVEVSATSNDLKLIPTIVATGDSKLGQGARGYIPFHLLYEVSNLNLKANRPVQWRLALKELSQK